MDLKLTDAGDLDLTEGRLSLVDGLEAVRQRCLLRLRTYRGEWFMDQRVGMPWVPEVLGSKPVATAAVAQRIRQALLSTPGVTQVLAVTPTFDSRTRELSVAFTAAATLDGRENVFSADFVLT